MTAGRSPDLASPGTALHSAMPQSTATVGRGTGNPYQLLAEIDGNLATNTWSTPTVLSGSDLVGTFALGENASGEGVIVYASVDTGTSTAASIHAVTRGAPGQPWSAPVVIPNVQPAVGVRNVAVSENGEAIAAYIGYDANGWNSTGSVVEFQP